MEYVRRFVVYILLKQYSDIKNTVGCSWNSTMTIYVENCTKICDIGFTIVCKLSVKVLVALTSVVINTVGVPPLGERIQTMSKKFARLQMVSKY